MSENQPPPPEEQPPQPEQPAPETPQQPDAPEGPQVPEAAPTDFRRNIYLLVIILAVVVLAWVVSMLSGPPAAAPEAPAAEPPALPQQQAAPPAESAVPRAEPVSAIRVVGSDRILLAAAPAQVVKRGDQSYRMPEETFDATQRAADFDALALARLPRRWAGQRPVVAAAGKVQQLFQPAVTVPDLEPADRIVTVTIGEETHAYPVLLLYSVAGVLDLVGGRQVFVTWSPVTQVARCLVPQVDDKPLELQDAGLVYRGNELLFDVGTGSLWDTLTGAALTGPMVGKTVQVLPSDVLPWGQLKQDQPTANVLVLPGTTFDKQVRDRVEAYLNSPAIPVPVVPPKAAPAAPAAEAGEAPQAAGQGGPPPKAFVLGIAVGKESRAYDLGALFSAGKKELKDAVGGRDFEITVTSPRTAQATSGGNPVDAPVMLYFGWKQAHPETTVYGAAAPAAAPEPPAAP